MKLAVALLLAMVPRLTLAQTGQDERRDELLAKLRACVRLHATEAQAAAVRGIGDPITYFARVCSPALDDVDLAKVGALPPGIFRITVTKEWNAITKEAPTR